MDIILASASQRRKELMELMGLEFRAVPASVDETIDANMQPDMIVKELSLKKADAVLLNHPNAVVVGSDTIVVYDGKILGKPKNEQDAFTTLKMLSGKTHTVYTGIAVVSKTKKLCDVDATDVTFATLFDDEIYNYIKSGDPMDKAGSYGIQGRFCVHIKHISGSFFSVMGLPVHKLYDMLSKIDVM